MEPILISGALSLAAWYLLQSHFPWQPGDPTLATIGRVDAAGYVALYWTWRGLLFAAPYALISPAVRAVWKWERKRRMPESAGVCRPVPSSRDLQVAIGTVQAEDGSQSWVTLGEKSLTRDILIIGARGAGKTSSGIMPILKQFVEYRADDREHKMSGIVLEVKDTMADDVEQLMRSCGRGEDLVRIGLTGWRYNPLANEIEPKTLATYISNLLRATYGGKVSDDFWVTGPIAAMTAIITIYRLADGYVTLADVYEAISNIKLIEEKLDKIRGTVGTSETEEYWVISEEDYTLYKSLRPLFTWDKESSQWMAPQSSELAAKLKAHKIKHEGFEWDTRSKLTRVEPVGADPDREKLFRAMEFWYKYDWKDKPQYTRLNLAASITDKLSIFFINPQLRETFCPPKEDYNSDCSYRFSSRDTGVSMGNVSSGAGKYIGVSHRIPGKRPILTSFDEIISTGKVAVMDLPSTMDPMGARLIGLLTDTDWQSSQLRRTSTLRGMPYADRRRSFEIIDEFQYFITHGQGFGTHRYMEIKRETLCTLVAATQSISALDSEIGQDGRKTIVGLFGNVGIYRCDDDETAEWAARFCGDEWRPKKSYGVSESGRHSKVLIGGPAISAEKGVGVSQNTSFERIKRFYPDDFRRGLPDFTAVWSINDGTNTARPVRCRMRPVHEERSR